MWNWIKSETDENGKNTSQILRLSINMNSQIVEKKKIQTLTDQVNERKT